MNRLLLAITLAGIGTISSLLIFVFAPIGGLPLIFVMLTSVILALVSLGLILSYLWTRRKKRQTYIAENSQIKIIVGGDPEDFFPPAIARVTRAMLEGKITDTVIGNRREDGEFYDQDGNRL